MKYLIAGKSGQLAQAFIRRLESVSADYQAPDEAQFDITNAGRVEEIAGSYKPGVIINCAAYNLVDKAEDDRDTAFRVNAIGPKNLAQAAKRHRSLQLRQAAARWNCIQKK